VADAPAENAGPLTVSSIAFGPDGASTSVVVTFAVPNPSAWAKAATASARAEAAARRAAFEAAAAALPERQGVANLMAALEGVRHEVATLAAGHDQAGAKVLAAARAGQPAAKAPDEAGAIALKLAGRRETITTLEAELASAETELLSVAQRSEVSN
jgi:hypothetical protein